MRVGLLMVGHVADSAVPIAGDYPELFDALLGDHGIELVRYDLDADRFPTSTDECEGWLCSPSRCSTYDDHGWIASAEDFLRELIAKERKYVGICFGHQLLAQAMGTPVLRSHDGWQVGVQEYEIVERTGWMTPQRDGIALPASHEDQVSAVPEGARLLARSEGCAVAGLLVGDRAWTLQPHPEFTSALADHLYEMRTSSIGEEKVSAARASLTSQLDSAVVAQWIANFFGS
ncbi:MAG: hypothetical protein EXQ69_07615 [Acidimicrobiia bacterium]|nr:hypothetical protein [Acidimicrobiia bacterium]